MHTQMDFVNSPHHFASQKAGCREFLGRLGLVRYGLWKANKRGAPGAILATRGLGRRLRMEFNGISLIMRHFATQGYISRYFREHETLERQLVWLPLIMLSVSSHKWLFLPISA
jgi:hypothetical protein